MDEKIKKKILAMQQSELNEHIIYRMLSRSVKDSHNREVLGRIAEDELKHHNLWKEYTKVDVRPNKFIIYKYYLIARILGLTFGVKLMEAREQNAQVAYNDIATFVPDAKNIEKEEIEHERQLLNLIDEERLKYIGSMVLGLNDALVELTGALAGLTLALKNTRLVATVGLITGIAASFSMATSEYLSTKSESDGKNPLKASVYTGLAYILTVLCLIFPFLLFQNIYFCLGFTLLNALIIIFIFNFYISIAKDISFKKRFSEMALISLGIAALTFVIGFFIRKFLHIDI